MDFRTLSPPQSDNIVALWCQCLVVPSRGWITLSELEAGGGAGMRYCDCQVGGSKMC